MVDTCSGRVSETDNEAVIGNFEITKEKDKGH